MFTFILTFDNRCVETTVRLLYPDVNLRVIYNTLSGKNSTRKNDLIWLGDETIPRRIISPDE